MAPAPVLAALLTCFVAASAHALPGAVLARIELGSTRAAVQSALAAAAHADSSKLRIESFAASEPQRLREALLESNLVPMLHRAGAAALDAQALHETTFVTANDASRSYLFVFIKDALTRVLVRRTVTPDRTLGAASNPFVAARLSPIITAQSDLAGLCHLEPVPGQDTNVRDSRGACGAAKIWQSYEPERDAIWTLFYR